MEFIKKLFSFSIGSILSLFIGVISTPIITRVIEPSEYGIASIFFTVGSLISILSLAGLDQAFVRFFYETNRINLFKKCIYLSIVMTTIVSITLLLFHQPITEYISPNGNYTFLLILYVIALFAFRFSSLILRMLQFGYRYSLVQVLQKILDLFFILSIALIFLPNGYALIIGSILTLGILALFNLILTKSFWINDNNENKIVSSKELLKYSFPLLISSFMVILFQTLDKLFLNAMVTSEELGIYSAGFKLIAILNIIQSSFTLFWAPVSLEHYKKNPEDKMFYERVSKLITVIMISVCIIVVMLKDIIILFLGSDYRDASSVIAILVLMPVMYTMSETTVQGINFSLKTYLHIVISGVALAINIILCIILIPYFGIDGAAISVSLSYVVFYLVRSYLGLKKFYFDNKMFQTLIMIFCLIIWMINVVFNESPVLLVLGGLTLLILLFIFFRKEVLECKILIKNILKDKKL